MIVYVILLSVLLSCALSSAYFYVQFEKQEDDIKSNAFALSQMSATIESNLELSAHWLDSYIYNLKLRNDFLPKLKSIMQMMYSSIPNIAGFGYAQAPEFGKHGFYLSLNDHQHKAEVDLNKVYHQYHTYYYERPWFKQVMTSDRPVFDSPERNIMINNGYTMSFSFPVHAINKDGKQSIQGVGVIDVSMAALFQKLRQYIIQLNHRSDQYITFYYVSNPSLAHKNIEIYKLLPQPSAKPAINRDMPEVIDKLSLLNDDYPNETHWHYINGALYKRLSYFGGKLSFIVKYNFWSPLYYAALWGVFLMLCCVFIFLLVRYRLRHKISLITRPIAEVSQVSMALCSHQELIKPLTFTESSVFEILHLQESIHAMRQNVLRLIEQDERLAKQQSMVNVAASIQQKFILNKYQASFDTKDLSLKLESMYHPADKVSGDIYDIAHNKNAVYLFLADATGKDFSAAIYATFALMRFKILAEYSHSPSEILSKLNSYLLQMNIEKMYLTAVCIKFDLEKETVEYALAGHDMPIFIDKYNNELAKDMTYKPILGVIDNQTYSDCRINLNQISKILLFSDGLSEARNNIEGMFSRERLVRELQQSIFNLESLAVAINTFEDEKLKDDKSAIYIKVDHLHRS